MISQYLSSLSGVEHLGEATLIVSMVAFGLLVFRVLRTDRDRIARWERLPFEDNAGRGKEARP